MCRQCQPVELVLRGRQLLLELEWKKRVYPFADWAGGHGTCFWMPKRCPAHTHPTAGSVPWGKHTQRSPGGCEHPVARRSSSPSSPAPLRPAHPAGHPAGILIFPKISRGAGASAHRQQVTNKIFPLSRAPGMGLSLKMQSSAVPTSAIRSHLCQPLSAEHPAR